jgi:acetyl esterase/lipase
MYLQAAEFDTVLAGVTTLARNAGLAAVDVRYELWPGMIHGWHGLVNMEIEESVQAWQKIRQYMDGLAK